MSATHKHTIILFSTLQNHFVELYEISCTFYKVYAVVECKDLIWYFILIIKKRIFCVYY